MVLVYTLVLGSLVLGDWPLLFTWTIPLLRDDNDQVRPRTSCQGRHGGAVLAASPLSCRWGRTGNAMLVLPRTRDLVCGRPYR